MAFVCGLSMQRMHSRSMIGITQPVRRWTSGATIIFKLIDTDVSELTALALHCGSIGRHSIADETYDLATRVQAALLTRGICHAHQFTFSDFGRLMGRLKYAAQISESSSAAIRDLACRIWCGLTGDATCPISLVSTYEAAQ